MTVTASGMDGNSSVTLDLANISSLLNNGGSYTITEKMMSPPYVPMTLGQQTITGTISTPAGITTAPQSLMALNVYQTPKLTVGIVPVNQASDLPIGCTYPGCIGNPSNGNITQVLNQASFASKVFPVADNSVTLSPLLGISGDTDTIVDANGEFSNAIARDREMLLIKKGKMQGVSTIYSRIVGVVGSLYLANRGLPLDLAGRWYPDNIILLSEAAPTGLVHELSHSFGQRTDFYSGGAYSPYYPVNGYDATSGRCYQYPIGDGAPSPVDPNCIQSTESIMGPADGASKWMDAETYPIVFRYLKQSIPDPEVLLVSGILENSGKFTFDEADHLQYGNLTPSSATGDVVVSAFDQNDRLLSSVQLQSDFSAINYPGPGAKGISINVSVAAIPIVVELPFDANIDSIQVSSNRGKIANKVSLDSLTLQGIVASIPDQAFKSRSHRHRNDHDSDDVKLASSKQIKRYRIFLANEVAEIQKLLNSKRAKQQVFKTKETVRLLKELIEQIRKMTFDNYVTVDATQLTQSQVILGIDAIKEKIE